MKPAWVLGLVVSLACVSRRPSPPHSTFAEGPGSEAEVRPEVFHWPSGTPSGDPEATNDPAAVEHGCRVTLVCPSGQVITCDAEGPKARCQQDNEILTVTCKAGDQQTGNACPRDAGAEPRG
jgi:hypothetical protein